MSTDNRPLYGVDSNREKHEVIAAIALRLLRQARGKLTVVFGPENDLVIDIDRGIADIETIRGLRK